MPDVINKDRQMFKKYDFALGIRSSYVWHPS